MKTAATKELFEKTPMRPFILLVMLTVVAVVWMAWGLYTHSRNEVREETDRVTTKRLRGGIIQFEEATTMSARLAAVSGDLRWAVRSEEFEAKLKAAFEEAMTYVSSDDKDTPAAGWKASDQLEKMRKEALQLVREGKLQQAQEILLSDTYDSARHIYLDVAAKVCSMSHYWILSEYLKERILFLDEALTMSALLASYSGDARWEQRYKRHDVQLVDALEETLLLVPKPRLRDSVATTEKANVALVAMEMQAFEFVRENRLPEAQALLTSDAYRQQKLRYSQAMTDFSDELTQISENAIHEEEIDAVRHTVEVAVVVLLLAVTGFIIFRLFRDWQEAMILKNMELKNLNKTLDEKVQERTGQLEIQRKALEVANKDLRKNEEAVRAMYKDIKKVHDEYKQTQIQLIQSEKLASIGQLAAGIAHEINNPVGFVSSNLQSMSAYMQKIESFFRKIEELRGHVRLNDHDKAKVSLDEIDAIEEGLNIQFMFKDIGDLLKESHSGVDRIQKIVTDLKTFARKDKDETSLINLQNVLDEVLNILNNELKYTCEIIKEYEPVPLVKCNPQKLGQVFMNLLLNAKQAIVGTGRITIRTYRKDGAVCVDIADTGKGIAPEIMSDIFLPFFTTKPVGLGTGLGLSISYDIVKSYQGEIRVQSEVGKGSTFTVVLPVHM